VAADELKLNSEVFQAKKRLQLILHVDIRSYQLYRKTLCMSSELYFLTKIGKLVVIQQSRSLQWTYLFYFIIVLKHDSYIK
jgi:hypothetical protein